MTAERVAQTPPAKPPAIGEIVDTIYGRQQVMDVLDGFPHETPTMYLRPEGGGREWCVSVEQLGRVLREAGNP